MSEDNNQQLRFQPGGKVLKAANIAIIQEIDTFVALQHRKANQVVDEANELKKTRAVEGFEAGYKDGMAKACAELLALQDAADQMVQTFEDRAIDLVLSATQRIVGKIEDHKFVGRMVQQALGEMRDQRKLRIRISPLMHDRLHAPLLNLATKRLPNCQIYIDADENLDRRECLIESAHGFLRLEINLLLQTLEKNLKAQTQRPAKAAAP